MRNPPATRRASVPEVLPPRKSMPGHARVIGCPNPFTTKVADGWCPAGLTVREAVQQITQANNIPNGWARHGHIWVNGRKVPRAMWDKVQVRAGQLVNFRIVPAGGGGGGGGKNPLRMVMSIAVMAAAWYAGPALLTSMGMQGVAANAGLAMGIGVGGGVSLGGAIVGGGISLLGNGLLNAIAPVSSSVSSSSTTAESEATETTYSLSGSSNSARKYEPLPVVLGRIRRQADHAALPYSEASGSDQWGHYLFFWGLGPLTVTEMKLGDTPLSEFLKSSTRDIMPEMEATTTGSTTITASAYSSTAWRLGNNARNTSSSFWGGGSVLPVDVDIDLGSIRGIQGYSLRPHASYLANMATAWTLYAGKTVAELTEIDTQTGQAWADGSKREYEFSAVHQVRHLRLRITAIGTGGTLTIDEFEALGGLLIETHEGRTGEADYTLYTGNTHEESIGALLPWEDNETQEYTIRYTEPGCTGFEIEWYAGQGLWRYQPNNSLAYGLTVTVEVLYRLKGSPDALKPVGASGAGFVASVAGVNERADRRACRFTLPSGDLAAGQYEIHQRRIARDIGNSNTDDGTIFDTLHWSVLRTFRPGNPVTLPLAWAGSALCVQANEDFTGSLPVFSGICASECLDWDAPTETWITRQTSNPSSLFRYWLQHPCRLNPVPDSRINLAKLEQFHEFCKLKGFEFNGETCLRGKSIRTVLRQICAAGRGSPVQPDGIFSVVWDDVQDEIRQLYNDRNSWNFKQDRDHGKIPHALRVTFKDEENDFEDDEAVVYAEGYSAANATLFETLSYDGVTNHAQIQCMGRNHLAQLKLRPVKYSWQTTMQYLLSPRGSLAAVASGVIQVGLVSARVKSVTWSEPEEDEEPEFALSVVLDQACAMEAGTVYALQYRRSDGKVTTQEVEYAPYETQVLTFAEPVLAILAPEEDSLATFGTFAAPSITMLVESFTPSDDYTATITAVDYAPGIFNEDLRSLPAWNPHITQPVYGEKLATPIITNVRSGLETLLIASGGSFTQRAEVVFSVPSGAVAVPSIIEVQHRQSGSPTWSDSQSAPVGQGALYIGGVEIGTSYEFRARTGTNAGLSSPWSQPVTHEVQAPTMPTPTALDGLSVASTKNGIAVGWLQDSSQWVLAYDIAIDGEVLEEGYSGSAYLIPPGQSGAHTIQVRERDIFKQVGPWSSASVTVLAPAAPSVTAQISGPNIEVNWTHNLGSLPLASSEILHGDTLETATSLGAGLTNTSVQVPGAAGAHRFWVRDTDSAGNPGPAGMVELVISAPGQVAITPQVIDNNVLLAWTEVKGTLPIGDCELRRGATYATSTPVGRIAGRFTTLFESIAGTYTYWITQRDNAGNDGTPASITVQVSQPPDYVLHDDHASVFGGTKTSALLDAGALLLPVNTTQTVAQKMAAGGWASRRAKANAGYPYRLEPTPGSASYQEIIDYGVILAGTKITVTQTSQAIHGSVALSCKLETSPNGSTWTDLGSLWSAYGTAFRYLRVTITGIPDGGSNDLVKLTELRVRLDVKLKNDAGMATCNASDSGGTQVNFNVGFVDIQSIVLTPASGGAARYALYEFTDTANPTGFKILLYDASGNRVSGSCSWSAKGV